MISIAKEKQIRLLLKKGLSNREIAKRTGTARATVDALKKLPKLRERKYKRLRRELKKLKEPRKCPTCEGMVEIWPCILCHPGVGNYDDPRPTEIPCRQQMSKALVTEIPQLLRIILDIQELHELHLIHHALFDALASRARASLQKLPIETGECNARIVE